MRFIWWTSIQCLVACDRAPEPGGESQAAEPRPVDLSGLYPPDRADDQLPPPDEMVNAGTAEVMRQLPSEFDVVASCCVLSQMSWAFGHLASPMKRWYRCSSRRSSHSSANHPAPHPTTGAPSWVGSHVIALIPAARRSGRERGPARITQQLAAEPWPNTVCNPVSCADPPPRRRAAATCELPPLGEPWLERPKELTYLVYRSSSTEV